VMFTAASTNGGTNPQYQWKRNGVNVGTNSSTYSSNVLANGDVISCVLTSSLTCAGTATVTSNAITMSVTSSVTPTISISTSSNTICAGSNVVFTATSTNGGTNPQYQWKRNGVNVGTNSSTYSSNVLANGDVISCVLDRKIDVEGKAADESDARMMSETNQATPTSAEATTAHRNTPRGPY